MMMEDDYLDLLPTPASPRTPPNQAIFTHTPFSFFLLVFLVFFPLHRKLYNVQILIVLLLF